MIRIADATLDDLIAEDVPYLDLTTHILDIGDTPGRISYFAREDCTLCCTEEVVRIMEKLELRVMNALPSGSQIRAGETFLVASGTAASLHMAWKVCLNLFDHYSAIATKTRRMVDAAHAVNPQCQTLTTRKSIPGNKALITKAIMTGGAVPHRLGLSETVLVFAQHLVFLGGFDAFVEKLPQIRLQACEKKLFVEADASQAHRLAEVGVDGIQFDKVPAEELASLVPELRTINPHITLIAAGGVHEGNAAQYAATGVDGLATTSLFTAKPLDMSVAMESNPPM